MYRKIIRIIMTYMYTGLFAPTAAIKNHNFPQAVNSLAIPITDHLLFSSVCIIPAKINKNQ